MKEVLKLADELDFYIYIDDAHGTSIFGEQGEGYVIDQLKGDIPDNLILTFCLSKGFGCNGGGVLLPNRMQETLVRTYGQIYAFSAALDFSVVSSCMASIELHKNGTVKKLQDQLRERVALYDQINGINSYFTPIRMVPVGSESRAIKMGEKILADGFFVSVVFFPIVPRNHAQLRICLAANHTEQQIIRLSNSINTHLESLEPEVLLTSI